MTNYRATYSPEDNKLRLYASSRLSTEDYQRVKKAGFKWAPKQELFVAPAWTPSREDLLLEFADEIEDEDYSHEERSADRAERFEGYRDKRRAEAGGHADTFDAGPSAFGHQNRARAERQAARHDRFRTRAVSQWSKAEYWQDRTKAVIAHALYKSSAKVRRGRILTIEADQRKLLKNIDEAKKRMSLWQKVLTLPGSDVPVIPTKEGYGIENETTAAGKLAYQLAAGYLGHEWGNFTHPRTGVEMSAYDLLTKDDQCTPAEVAKLWLAGRSEPDDPDSWAARWAVHYELRLNYERAMLAEEGGSAADVDIEVGGFIGKHQIHKVNRSPVTKRCVSVEVMGPCSNNYDRNGKPYNDENPRPMVRHRINIERFGENIYRAPTDEERAAFADETKERKAEAKAGKTTIPLINPTDEDAQRLQDRLNAIELERFEKKHGNNCKYATFTPSEVLRITQARYSANSKGEYAAYETRTLHDCGKISQRSSNLWTSERDAYRKTLGQSVCNLRIKGGNGFYAADRVIILTDKPQKPLPIVWEPVEQSEPVQQELFR